MSVDISILKDRTKQILRRLSHEQDLTSTASDLGLQLQSTKNLLYRQRSASGALSVGHLLDEFLSANIDPNEYEETCFMCDGKTSPGSGIVRDPEGTFCSVGCWEWFILDYMLVIGTLVDNGSSTLDNMDLSVLKSELAG